MMEYKGKQNDRECGPSDNPADQPKPPGHHECDKIPPTTPPPLKDPTPCPPDPCCKCPQGPPPTTNCLEELIAKQAAALAAGEKAKAVKADLEKLLEKAKTGAQDYTRDKFDKLVKQWVEQDAAIAELIRKLVCAVPCWYCIIECYVCPLIYNLRKVEESLYGDGTLYTEVHNLYDLLHWHARDKEIKERRLWRIQKVLAAWEKPAQTIEAILNENKALIEAAGKALASDAGKVIYDVFLRLVPKHLAIAPPSGSAWKTKISKDYTELCACDKGKPDDCCGPDIGERSLRQRLLDPLPYLVDPNDYLTIICCLVEQRYGPAQEALAKAEADWASVDNRIKRYKDQIENGLKSLEKDAKGVIPTVIDCSNYVPDEGESKSSQKR